jgi:hypothetical protein
MAKAKRANRITAEWAKLEAAVLPHCRDQVPWDPLYRHWIILRALRRWCLARRIWPHQVTEEIIAHFVTNKRRSTVSVRERTNRARSGWNFVTAHVAGWPATAFELLQRVDRFKDPIIRNGRIIVLGPEQFHTALRAQVSSYIENRGFLPAAATEATAKASHRDNMVARLKRLDSPQSGAKVFTFSKARRRLLAPRTAYEHARTIFLAATALHVSGEADVSELRSIADVVTPKAAAILADRICDTRSRPTRHAADAVRKLCSIATRCGVTFSVAEILALQQLIQELLRDVEITADLSERNLRRLSQFDDERLFSMLVALPDVELRQLEEYRAKGGFIGIKKARRAEVAIAVDILNTLPIRISTLAALDLERNFIAPWRHRTNGRLVIWGDQEKNEKRLEAQISPRSWRLLSLYCSQYRPAIPGADKSSLLFPARTRIGHTGPSLLGTAIRKVVKQRIKVDVTVDLWRHIMGTKLEERSERSGDGQRLLGHVTGSRSTNHYIRVNTSDAAKRLRAITSAVRNQGIWQLGYRRHRVRRRKVGGPTAPLNV